MTGRRDRGRWHTTAITFDDPLDLVRQAVKMLEEVKEGKEMRTEDFYRFYGIVEAAGEVLQIGLQGVADAMKEQGLNIPKGEWLGKLVPKVVLKRMEKPEE